MPSPTLGVSWNVEGEHRPAPQIEENSNKGGVRGGGEGMEERAGQWHLIGWMDPGRGAFETLSLCTIIILISQMRKVRLRREGPIQGHTASKHRVRVRTTEHQALLPLLRAPWREEWEADGE